MIEGSRSYFCINVSHCSWNSGHIKAKLQSFTVRGAEMLLCADILSVFEVFGLG